MLDLVDLAAELRDKGMSYAQWAQDSKSCCWSDRAYDALVRVCRRQGEVFTDDVRHELGDDPAHPNAWGAVWMRAIKAGIISRTRETRHSSDPRKRKHLYPVYRSHIRSDA